CGVNDHAGEWLVDLVGNRRRELPHDRDAAGVRQLHLHLPVTLLALARSLLSALAIGQIEHKGDTLIARPIEDRGPDKHRNAATTLAEIFLLEPRRDAGRLHFGEAFLVYRAPFFRGQLGPVQVSARDVLALVSYDLQEGVVALDNPAFQVPDDYTDNVGVDQ